MLGAKKITDLFGSSKCSIAENNIGSRNQFMVAILGILYSVENFGYLYDPE